MTPNPIRGRSFLPPQTQDDVVGRRGGTRGGTFEESSSVAESCRQGTTATRDLNIKLGVWTVDDPRTTGQAIVTRRVLERVLSTFGQYHEYVYRRAGSPKAIASWFSAWSRLWRDVATQRIDTLYLVCSRSNVGFVRDIPALLAARAGLRIVVHIHGSDIVDLLFQRPLSPLARMLYRRCELVLPSRHLREPLNDIRLRDLHVCENFATAAGPPVRDLSKLGRASLVVVANSNVMATKGTFDLMEAVGKLNSDGLAIELHMIGSVIGDEELPQTAAESRFAALLRPNCMTYHGRVATARAAEMVEAAEVIVLASRRECQPLAVIEGMCMGSGIIASDIPALRTTIGDYPAEFVPVRSVGGIAHALRRLQDEKRVDPAAFFARRAGPAEQARDRFSAMRFDAEMRKILAKKL